MSLSNCTEEERTTTKHNSKLKTSLNSNNKPVCSRVEILFDSWNAGKKKVELESFLYEIAVLSKPKYK